MPVEFPYVECAGDLGPVFRPYLPVTLSYETGCFPVGHALVDTGADMTLLPMAIAHLLRIELDDSRTIRLGSAGGGVFTALPSRRKIGFAIEQKGHRPLVWQGTAFFSSDQPVVLLGHFKCLEHFHLLFSGPERKLRVQR